MVFIICVHVRNALVFCGKTAMMVKKALLGLTVGVKSSVNGGGLLYASKHCVSIILECVI